MAQSLDPIDLIVEAAPSLRLWGEQHRDRSMSTSELCTHLIAKLREHIHNGEIPELQALAPIVEVLLDSYDDHDDVSLGLIEPLVSTALDGNLDHDRTRAVLGPTARLQWDSLYLGARMDDLRPIEFKDRPQSAQDTRLCLPHGSRAHAEGRCSVRRRPLLSDDEPDASDTGATQP